MSEKKNNKVLKVLIAILCICLIGLGIFTLNFYKDNKENSSIVHRENEQLQKELQQLKDDYQNLMNENSSLKDDLKAEQERISVLVDSLKKMDISATTLRKYRVQVELLKLEKERLSDVVDSLSHENNTLRQEIDSTSTMLEQNKKMMDSVNVENKQLAEKVKKTSILQISSITGHAVVLRNNKEAVEVTRAKRAEQLQVCFTINENPIIEPGERQLFIQVINPKNNLLGLKKNIQFKEKTLRYSSLNTIDYQNEELDICMLVEVSEKGLTEGRYVVNVFDGATLIGSTSFKLK
ncbi:hypothetical protein [Mesonia maritima]|uniref:Uncharacterized protein YoxC n=1 Tax=Mesonia maritima TaxID=1793873 RepID=A0ABU1K1Y1_9FLAO|nr:hypothetical protein [Mesonia maritima]MDR6299598.1 uncharacterized protein YoxC [Mesonia maritima]